ncbi:hypothetical protein ACFLTH_13130 [Bacteroidota bacterium]
MKNCYFLIFLILLNSCDLLSTRDPEDPSSTRSNFVAATTPEILFQNMVESFREKIVENYMACFVDQAFLDTQYSFIPSAGSASQFNILNDWSVDLEQQYFSNVRSIVFENSPIGLEFSNEISNPSGESAIYQFDYTLTVPTSDPSVPSSYQGTVQFNINLDSRQIWVITEWQDTQRDNLPSWSELKGRFY